MKNSEYWKNLAEHNAKRKRWKDRQVDKAVDIPIISEKTEQKILEALWKVNKSVLLKKIGV